MIDGRGKSAFAILIEKLIRKNAIRNELGWADQYGRQLAYDEEHAFMNNFTHEHYRRPIWKMKTHKVKDVSP